MTAPGFDPEVDRLAAQVHAQIRHLLSTCPACAEHRAAAGDAPAWTPRDLDVIHLVADGYTVPGIAAELEVQVQSVHTYLRHARRTAGVATTGAMIAVAFRTGALT